MARKLKTYTTPAGFFELAVAAPSMKAALQAWGSRMNLFHHGLAKATDDPDIVAATMAKPGQVLRRPIGTNERFGEHPDLPGRLAALGVRQRPAKAEAGKDARRPEVDQKAAREAAPAFAREEKRREAQRRREEAAEAKHRERREQAVAAAQAALEDARREHAARLQAIENERAILDRRSSAEDARWQTKKERLEAALRKARSAD